MSDVQIAVIDQQDTQIVLAVPGVQGATGSEIPTGGTADQVLRKNSSTDYDTNWSQVTSAMIADGTIVNADVNNAAAIAGTKISPDFGGQAVTTTGQISGARVNVTGNTAPTNGLYLPSANNVALSTNGTGRLFVDASGNVGVGEAPTSALSVASLGAAIVRLRGGSGSGESGALYVRNPANTLTLSAFGDTSAIAGGATGESTTVYSDGNAPLLFSVGTERLRITSAGLVGIGTSSVSDKLEIANGTTDAANALGIRSGRYLNAAQEGAQLKFYSDQTASWLGTREMARIGTYGLNSDHRIGSLAFFLKTTNSASNPSEMMRLTPTGLGIGTTNPKSIFTAAGNIVGLNTGTHSLQHYQQASSSYTVTSIDSVIDGATGSLVFKTNSNWTNGNAVERLRITSAGQLSHIGAGSSGSPAVSFNGSAPSNSLVVDSLGRVSIGTSLPGYNLDIAGANVRLKNASGSVELVLSRNSTSSGASISLNNGDTNKWFFGLRGLVDDKFYFYNNVAGNTALTIDEASRVGIGSTNPVRPLDLLSSTNNNSIGLKNSDTGSGIFDGFALQSSGLNVGLHNFEAGHIYLATSDIERARIDSSGRLLVGTSSTSAACRVVVQGSSGSPSGVGILYISAGTDAPGDGDAIGALLFSDSSHTESAFLSAQRDGGTWSASSKPTRLVFSTTADGASSPTERMRITSSGAILLGCTSAPNPAAASTTSGVAINGTGSDAYITAKQDGAPCGYFRRDTSDGVVFQFNRASTSVGSISVTASATAYNTSSDYRLKENVVAVTDGITRLQQLKPSRFNFIADPDKTVDGFLAHEVQAIVPEAITGEKDAVDDDGNPVYQGIDQSKLVPLLTAALQEAIAKIETLEARLTAAGI